MRASTVIAGLCGAIVIGHLPGIISEASAESCSAHLAKHGVTKSVDIAEHRAGTQPGKSPCDTGRSDDDTPRDNDRHGRDHFGFHCGLRGCG